MPTQTPEPRGFRLNPADVVDVFVYVVVLNIAVEYVPAVISETFTLSLLTAIVLKLVLEVVVWVKDRVKARITAAPRLIGKVVAALVLWLVLVGSKFVVLELIAFAFAGQVQLGGFFAVTGLIIVLMLARAGVRKLLGTQAIAEPTID
jgi:hypothetical protein